MQKERDDNTLRTQRLTLHDEDLMRKAMGQAGLPHRRGTKKARRADLDQDTEPDNCISQSAGHL